METKSADGIENVAFSVFGESFTLRCRKGQKESLLKAIANIQTKASKMLRDNPTLSPQQTAILIAIETESSLQNFINANTPFQTEASNLILKIKATLQNSQNGNK